MVAWEWNLAAVFSNTNLGEVVYSVQIEYSGKIVVPRIFMQLQEQVLILGCTTYHCVPLFIMNPLALSKRKQYTPVILQNRTSQSPITMVAVQTILTSLLLLSSSGVSLAADDKTADGRPCGAKMAPCPRGYTCQVPLTPCDPARSCIGKCRPDPDPVEGRPCGDEGDPPCPAGYSCFIPLMLCPPGEEERCRGRCAKDPPPGAR